MSLGAFAGGVVLQRFIEKFGLRDIERRDIQIEATASHENANRTVTLARAESNDATSMRGRLHVEVDGAVSIDWPRRLFPIVVIGNIDDERMAGSPMISTVEYIATAFGMTAEDLMDGLRPELFATGPLGYCFRETDGTIEVRRNGKQHFQPGNTLSGGEIRRAAAAILVRIAHAKRGNVPWTLVLDSSFLMRFDPGVPQLIIDSLLLYGTPGIQLVVCVNYQNEARPIQSINAKEWIGATKVDMLTVHSFR